MIARALGLMILIAHCAVWWQAVRAIAGDRLGELHWIPVAIACFGVPMLIADQTFRSPGLMTGCLLGWSLLGLLLAVSSLFRGPTTPST